MRPIISVLLLLVACGSMDSSIAAAAVEVFSEQQACDPECEGYCLYYFPSEQCVEACGCAADVAVSPSYLSIYSDSTTRSTSLSKEKDTSTCRTTCNLKCKSESADKKESCVSLCYNQCIASINLEKEKTRGPRVQPINTTLNSTATTSNSDQSSQSTNQSTNEQPTPTPDSLLLLSLQSKVNAVLPQCSTDCVSSCGVQSRDANLTSSEIKACFAVRCGCPNKLARSPYSADQTTKSYFQMIHNEERVEYLILQQEQLFTQIQSLSFLQADEHSTSQSQLKYLGEIDRKTSMGWINWLLLGVFVFIFASFFFMCITFRKMSERSTLFEPVVVGKSTLKIDCERAIRKKQKLEQS